MNPNKIEIIRRYISKFYNEEIKLIDCEDKNQIFDLHGNHHNFSLTIEYKNRDFRTGVDDRFLREDDILIELIQTLPYFTNNTIPSNKNINTLYKTTKINVSIGWFYKCGADRLFYIKYLDDKYYEFVDVDFRLFKGWFLNNLQNFELQYCAKTTGTINAKVPYSLIPKPLIRIVDINGVIRMDF